MILFSGGADLIETIVCVPLHIMYDCYTVKIEIGAGISSVCPRMEAIQLFKHSLHNYTVVECVKIILSIELSK